MTNLRDSVKGLRAVSDKAGTRFSNSKGQSMDDLWTVRRFCRWKYNLPDGTEPKKSQVNTVSKLCRDGKLPAMKLCGEWRIDTSEILKGVKR